MKESGQSLFELVIALSVITMVMIALVALGTVSVRNVTLSKNRNLATRLNQEAVEWLRQQRDEDWGNFSTRAVTQYYCLSDPSLSWANFGQCGAGEKVGGTIFLRELEFTIVDPIPATETIRANIRVYWNDAQGYHETSSSNFYTNWINQ